MILLYSIRSVPLLVFVDNEKLGVREFHGCCNSFLEFLGYVGFMMQVLSNQAPDSKVLPTMYGELRPPLGKHCLKIVEFIAVLLKSGNEAAGKELASSGTIKRILDLFFE